MKKRKIVVDLQRSLLTSSSLTQPDLTKLILT